MLHGTAIDCDANDRLPTTNCVPNFLLWCLLLQLQKLVVTQENLQQQLAAQVDLSNVKSGSHQQELQQLSQQLKQTEQQLQDVQDAMAAVVDKLQVNWCEAAAAAAAAAWDASLLESKPWLLSDVWHVH